MNKKKLNIGCGDTFINDISWINIDIDSNSKDVISHNILKDIPFSNESFDFIYTSHFIEHIPLEKIDFFFRECSRVLKKRGVYSNCYSRFRGNVSVIYSLQAK